MQESRTGRNSFPQFEDEKPLFDNSQTPPGPSEPLFLSGLEVKVPSTINRYLRDYQRDGITFIYHNYAKSRGCILGDDMGLGKTVQVIGFLAAVLQKTGTWKDVENNRPEFLQSQKPPTKTKSHKVFLIVAPLSVLYNWKDELDTWGHFRVVIVHSVRKDEELARIQRGRCEIALTTYETFRLCLDQFNSIDWAAIIVDEAHKIKNHRSQITQAMKEMKCKVRVGLTGTILQNNLEELWCVMDWAVPGCLGSLMGFKNQFSDPIEQGHKHTVTKRTLAEGRKAVANLAKRLSRYFLRRTKSFISDQLPKKDDRVVYCSLTDFQETVYRAVLDTDDVVLMLQSSEKCPCGSGRLRKKCCYKLNADGVPLRNLYFSYLAILRKVANHVALLQSREGTSKSQEKFVTAVCEKVFKKFPEFTDRCKQAAFEAMSDPMYSGKMKVLQKLLNHFVMKKSKVLLFSYSTKLLDVLESFCMAEGLEFLRLDGNTKSKERVKIVKDFNGSRDVHLCLVSTLAGGLGLNFTGANVVVLFDPTWNPANDLQAIDRAYRIGQCRDVTVFRLISLGTVEEIIYLRQIYKQQLQSSVLGRENARRYFEAVQGSDGEGGELFGIPNLFRLQTKGSCLTHQILEREVQVEVGIMTTRTQVLDQRTQDPVDVTPSEQAGPSAATGPKQTSVLDFSSGSEDEDPCCSLKRPPEPLREGELTSGKSGLYDLLQKHMAQRVQQDLQDDSAPHEEEYPETRLKSHKSWDLSSESEEETDRFPLMEASDDAPSSSSHHKTRRKNHVHKQVKGTDSETEGSSDDEEQMERVKTVRFSHLHQNKLQMCGSNKTQFADGGNTATIDSLLGGLQQVSYTHSNQKVVGPSSTEDRLSRAAVRDVFKLNMHSQFPANQLLDLSQTPGQTSEATHTDGGQAVEAHTRPHVEHPVKHTTKTTYRQKDGTVIVGETPSAICRQQMEDMAKFFDASSVEDFAEEIVKGNSEHRLGRLRSFYDHENPDLTHLCKKTFVNPDTGPEADVSPQRCASRQRSTSKRTFPSPQQFQDEVTTPKDSHKRKLKKKKLAFDSSGLHIQAKLLDKTSSSSDGNISNVPSTSYAPVDESEVDLRCSPEPFNDQEDRSQTPRATTEERPASDSAQNNITDLIGDTSILNDLFKTTRKTVGNLKEAAASACTERAKHRRKDFWDILNEGNEDNIDKLTDLTEVEKICTSARVSEKSKSGDLLETSQLWKKNENFLWKF